MHNKQTKTTTINSIQEIIDDMAKCHEAEPHGVPDSYGWNKCPRLAMGNEPGDFAAMMPWGQVYVPLEGNSATNTRVQLKNLKAYYDCTDDKYPELVE